MIYLVTGFPRSGTSMMMACLEAGGMECVSSPQRDCLNDAHADALYRPNPHGLYEPSMAEMSDPTFPRMHEGKAVKVVVPFLGRLAVASYRVLFMRRDAEEIRQSLEGAFGERLTCERIENAVSEAIKTLANRRDVDMTTEVEYRWVLKNPQTFFRSLYLFGWPINPEKAAAAVQPELCRFKRELLTEGL